MPKKIIPLLFIFINCSSILFAQITTYNWPIDSAHALLSDKYEVYVKEGSGPEKQLEVLMSNAIYKGDWKASELQGRTFSFASLSYDTTQGQGLNFRIVKIFGSASSSVVISPQSYGINSTLSTDGKEVTFSINNSGKYISVNFVGSDNRTSPDGWIENMLCIFIDPPESNIPDTTNSSVAVYNPNIASSELSKATTIYFAPGYYNLKNYKHSSDIGSIITKYGEIILTGGKNMYISGGAFIEGYIEDNSSGSKIYGRGILSGRQYIWPNSPDYDSVYVPEMIQLSYNDIVDGIMVMESPRHGIVGGNSILITNLKFLGWHSNNDGIRVGSGSEIKDGFMRAVDDNFYDFNIYVHNMVLWAGHNGSIMTFGWGGTGGNTYNSGSSLMEDIDIINPEWVGLGNNNGLIMAQTGLDYKPYDYGTGDATTIFKNIRIEGSIPGITNIKPHSQSNGTVDAKQVDINKVGYLGDVLLENITVNKQFNKGRIFGVKDAAYNGNATYYVRNITMKNVEIDGVFIDSNNVKKYFVIDTSTTKNIKIFSTVTGINLRTKLQQPNKFNLYQNYPNPFNPLTKIVFILPQSCFVKLTVYNILGREVFELINKEINSGKHEVNFNASGLASGIYFYRLTAGNHDATRKMIILK